MGRPFFEYRTDEADAIHAALQASGLQYEKHWPDYRAAIERHMRVAVAMASNGRCLMLRKLRNSSRPSPRPSQSRSDSMKHYRLNFSSLIDTEVETVLLKTRCSLTLSLHLRGRW